MSSCEFCGGEVVAYSPTKIYGQMAKEIILSKHDFVCKDCIKSISSSITSSVSRPYYEFFMVNCPSLFIVYNDDHIGEVTYRHIEVNMDTYSKIMNEDGVYLYDDFDEMRFDDDILYRDTITISRFKESDIFSMSSYRDNHYQTKEHEELLDKEFTQKRLILLKERISNGHYLKSIAIRKLKHTLNQIRDSEIDLIELESDIKYRLANLKSNNLSNSSEYETLSKIKTILSEHN